MDNVDLISVTSNIRSCCRMGGAKHAITTCHLILTKEIASSLIVQARAISTSTLMGSVKNVLSSLTFQKT